MQKIWIWVVVAVIVIGGGLWLWSAQSAVVTPGAASSALSDDGTPAATDVVDDQNAAGGVAPTPSPTPASGGAAMSATITYTDGSFSPAMVTIKKGGTITWKGPANMWIASAPHPAHTGYDGTSRSEHCAAGYTGAKPLDECATGGSYSFTFDKVGTWPYHDHMNASSFGKIVVVE